MPDDNGKKRPGWGVKIRKYLLTGLIIWLPIVVTLYVIFFIVGIMDKSIRLLPARLQPEHLLGFPLPGLGLILTLVILFLTGVFVTNLFGRKLFSFWERILDKIPLVRSVYKGVKQIVETILEPSGNAFKKVYLVEYPRKGLWSIAFLTGVGTEEVVKKVEKEMLTLFIPTTPNPTSGFLIMVPKEEAHELNMKVDQAMKMVISLGVVQPVPEKLLKKVKDLNT